MQTPSRLEEMPEMLTIPDCAAVLRVSHSTVRCLIHQRLLPAKKVGRSYRIWREHLRALVEATGQA